jgi:Domain of unknown function (DUF4331)
VSHHISGPRAFAEPIADITDLYAFPCPERPGHLVLVLNTLPFAAPDARFSDALIYRFRLRRLTHAAADAEAPFAPQSEEHVVDCVFSTPDGGEAGPQRVTCTLPGGGVVTAVVGDEEGGEAAGGRVFAGARWDPFILDAPAGLKTIATGELAFTDPGSIYLDGKNVLGLVVELDSAAALDVAALVAVVGETLTSGKLNVRLERAGRPEVPNFMLAPKQFDQVNRDVELRDLWNMDNAFHPSHDYEGAYRARLNANLAFWDGLDGEVDWPLDERGAHPLTELMLADFLVVDVTRPYAENGTFLEIERASLRGEEHRTCGGRSLNDDAMDTLLTLLVNDFNGPVVRDGVDQSSRPATRTFPYLAAPNPDPPHPPQPPRQP